MANEAFACTVSGAAGAAYWNFGALLRGDISRQLPAALHRPAAL